jgi:hypothetical protein
MIKKSSTRILNEALSSMFNKEPVLCHIVGDKIIEWNEPELSQPSQEAIDAKIAELEAAEPMRLLRIERDRKLAEVDWWTSRALDGTPLTEEQTAYRQALRDLPENSANVAIDENGTLINVEWPVKPE